MSTDHKPFLETADRLLTTRSVTNSDARTISAHAGWLRKFIEDKKRASASRKTFGRQRKPDNEVTLDALRKRQARQQAKEIREATS